MAPFSSSPDTGASAPAPRSPWRRLVLIGVVAAVVLAVAVGVVLARGNDAANLDDQTRAATQQIEQACRQWHRQSPSGDLPAAWCDDMAARMGSQAGTGHMSWADPERLRETCVAAFDQGELSHDQPVGACRDMVDWMARHPDQWMHGQPWPDWRSNDR